MISRKYEFENKILTYQAGFNAAYYDYELCYRYFNTDATDSDVKCKTTGSRPLTCNKCLESREKKIIQALNGLIEIQSIIAEEIKSIHRNQELPEITDKEKGKVVNIVKRHKTASESLMDSVELYKIYRIRIILEVIKLIIIIFFIFYLLKTTQGVKTMTFISTILYIMVTLLDVFYSNYGLIIFSVLSFIIFVISAIININDITINYQNIANKTADTLSNISTEFKKDVNIL